MPDMFFRQSHIFEERESEEGEGYWKDEERRAKDKPSIDDKGMNGAGDMGDKQKKKERDETPKQDSEKDEDKNDTQGEEEKDDSVISDKDSSQSDESSDGEEEEDLTKHDERVCTLKHIWVYSSTYF